MKNIYLFMMITYCKQFIVLLKNCFSVGFLTKARRKQFYITCFFVYQINVYTNVPHTVHVLFILSKISKDILRTCLRTFEADIPKIFKNVQTQSKNSIFF